MNDFGLDLAVIGNGRTAALVDLARLVWWCYPRFDGDPIFCRLVAGERKRASPTSCSTNGGFQSEYIRNTAIVCHVLTDRHGGKVRITDFAPRFRQYGRVFRPPQLFRIVEPIAGLPRITIRMRPTSNYGKPMPRRSLGSNHIRYADETTRHPPDHRRAGVLIDERIAVRSDPADAPGHGAGRAVSRRPVDDLPRIRRSHAGLLDRMGAPAVDLL